MSKIKITISIVFYEKKCLGYILPLVCPVLYGIKLNIIKHLNNIKNIYLFVILNATYTVYYQNIWKLQRGWGWFLTAPELNLTYTYLFQDVVRITTQTYMQIFEYIGWKLKLRKKYNYGLNLTISRLLLWQFFGVGEYIPWSTNTKNIESIFIIWLHKHANSKLQTKFRVYQTNIECAMVLTVTA